MKYPTDGRSIVTNLAWGILMICVCGSPAEVSGQLNPEVSGQLNPDPEASPDASTTEEAHAGVWFVPARDVEDLDGLTRLLWTLQMIFTPSALAHVSPLYAYDPRKLAGRTVHPDRIGDVAIVRTCPPTWSWWEEERVGQDHGVWCVSYMSNIREAFDDASTLLVSDTGEVYFGTTYPIPGIEPEKRFVAELPR